MSDTTDPASTLSAAAPFTLRTTPYFDAGTWTHGDCRSFAGEEACTPPHSPPSQSSGGIIKEQMTQ